MQPATAYPVQMDGYDPAQQAPGIPQTPAPGLPPQLQGPTPEQMQAMKQLNPEQQAQVGGMSPEARAEFLTLLTGDFGGQITGAENDMTRADALRNAPRAEGRNAGRTYSAANPLEHIADVMRYKKGEKDYGTAKGERTTAQDSAAALRKQIAEQMMGRSDALIQL